MASFRILTVLAIVFVLQAWPATSDVLAPVFSPIFDSMCKQVECGKGTCKVSKNGTFGFVCECERGWKQARLQDDDGFNFLPCVIPDCNFNFTCAEGPSPAQEKDKQTNSSIFDPCHWTDCGGGICNKTSSFTHRCECKEGYTNLLNSTLFPCFSECAMGMDCVGLGIGISNSSSSSPPNLPDESTSTGESSSSSSSPPNLPDESTSTASSISRADFSWLIVIAVSLGLLSSSR